LQIVIAGNGIRSIGVSYGWNTVITGVFLYLSHICIIKITANATEIKNATSQNILKRSR